MYGASSRTEDLARSTMGRGQPVRKEMPVKGGSSLSKVIVLVTGVSPLKSVNLQVFTSASMLQGRGLLVKSFSVNSQRMGAWLVESPNNSISSGVPLTLDTTTSKEIEIFVLAGNT